MAATEAEAIRSRKINSEICGTGTENLARPSSVATNLEVNYKNVTNSLLTKSTEMEISRNTEGHVSILARPSSNAPEEKRPAEIHAMTFIFLDKSR